MDQVIPSAVLKSSYKVTGCDCCKDFELKLSTSDPMSAFVASNGDLYLNGTVPKSMKFSISPYFKNK